MPDIPARKDVPEDQTWNVAAVFPTRQDWEDGFKKAALLFPALQNQFEGHLGDSPEILLDWLEKKQPAYQLILRLEQYAYLNYSVDTSNPEGSEMYGRISSLGADCAAAFAFEEPELMTIGFKKIKSWIKQNPNLALYAHFFDSLERKAAHVRSNEVEVLLSQVQDPFQAASEIHGILVNADLHFKPAIGTAGEKSEVTHSKTRELFTSSDRKLRRNGWKSYSDGHLAFKNTMANSLAAGMKQDAFFAKARRYSSSLEFSLESVDLPVSVFHNVVNAFKANLPVWHRYWDLRRKVMGLKKLRVYDTYAAFSDKKVAIPYNQAVEWICAGLQPLGREYVEIVRKGATSDRWVDRAANKGKQFGAFSYGAKGSPPFILMSYDNSIYSFSTLAHELGHAMHSYFTCKSQPLIYSFYGLFTAEVASNFHQALIRAYMLENQADPAIRLAVLEEAMSNFYRYFFTMPILAQFDLEVHQRAEQGGPLSADSFNQLMAGYLREGYGAGVDVDEARDGCLWTQFSTHLYRNFYNYQYTTGIAGAHALAAGVLSKKPGAVENYLAFLNAGSSRYPLDVLKMAGVDLSSPDPVNQAFCDLDGYITELEKLLVK